MPATSPYARWLVWALVIGLIILLISVAMGHPGTEPCPFPDAGEPTPEQQARCVNQTYTCTAYTPPGSSFAPDGGPPYVPLIMAGQRCPVGDAGVTIPVIPTPSPEVIVDPSFCTEHIGPDGGAHLDPQDTPIGLDGLGTDAFGCACKIGPDCRLKAADGGTALAAWGETLPYQSSQGLQCVGKVCVEIAGISSWPEECPTRRPLFDGGFPLPDGGVFDGGLEDF